jgi:hypothetical protein
MEPFQPFLIALLAVVMTTSFALLIRTRRERRQRRQEQAIIDAATPRMHSRLSAIGDPSIPPEPEPPYVPYVPVVAAPHPIPSVAEATISRRRVWRDASAALVVVAAIGLVIILALPAAGMTAPDQTVPPSLAAAVPSEVPTDGASPQAVALVASPLPTRIDVVLPTEEPTPTLPVTATPPPTQKPAVIARATPRPTPRPKATPRPTPRPTPVPQPVARFTCSFASGTTIALTNTSKTYGAKATWSWTFGDGVTSSSKSPGSHSFPDSGFYVVKLKVTTKGGVDTFSRAIDISARTGCS